MLYLHHHHQRAACDRSRVSAKLARVLQWLVAPPLLHRQNGCHARLAPNHTWRRQNRKLSNTDTRSSGQRNPSFVCNVTTNDGDDEPKEKGERILYIIKDTTLCAYVMKTWTLSESK